jgi:hypothetical protein
MLSSPFRLLMDHIDRMAFDTILVDHALGEKPFVVTNPSKGTPPFAVQGP